MASLKSLNLIPLPKTGSNPTFDRRVRTILPNWVGVVIGAAAIFYGDAVVYQRLERMDRELNGHQFVAGERFTIVDITALVAIDIGGRLADIKIAPELTHLTRWHNAVSKRASAHA